MAITSLSRDQHTQRLADYMPGGRLFRSKNIADSNFRKLLRGLSHELFTADGLLRDFQQDINPNVTTYFLNEWEQALGIPDDCFPGSGTEDERRRDILIKLSALGIQTVDDFVELAAVFGITVDVHGGRYFSKFPLEFPILLFDSEKASRFTIVVDFTVDAASKLPLTFPFTFGDEIIGGLECLFRRLKPANCDILFRQV